MGREELEVDRLRVKFPRSYKALVQLYPVAWNQMLAVVEAAMAQGQTASVIAGKLSILRGLDRSTRRWVVLSIQADRREIRQSRPDQFSHAASRQIAGRDPCGAEGA